LVFRDENVRGPTTTYVAPKKYSVFTLINDPYSVSGFLVEAEERTKISDFVTVETNLFQRG